jgi:hypothetical protein
MQTRAEATSESTSLPSPNRLMVVGRGGRKTLRWVFAGAGYALLLLGWVFASPFGAAPDEPAHTVRALAAASGQWQGQPATPYQRTGDRTSQQAGLLNEVAQDFTVPASLLPADPCFARRPDKSAACANASTPSPASGTVHAATYETTAPPGVYTIAGLAMRLPQQAIPPGYLGRLALALVCALLLAGAAWAAGARGALWPLAGVALAATPMVLFLGASVGTAGVAAAAAICFTTGVLAFWMATPRRGLSPLIGASGAILALSSAGGALALVALIVAVLPLVRLRRLTEPGAVLASAVVTAALVAGVALALGSRHLPPGGVDLGGALATATQSAPALLQQTAGVYGWTDLPLPFAAYAVWGGMVVIGLATALVLGGTRERLSLVLVAGLALAAATVAEGFVLMPVGWNLRGSFVLPILVAAPIVAGFVLHASRLAPRADALLLGAGVVGVQLFALWENARRYAVGQQGPPNFLDSAAWTPPGGWTPWLVVAAAGGVLVLAALVPLTRRESDDEALGPLVIVDPISVGR